MATETTLESPAVPPESRAKAPNPFIGPRPFTEADMLAGRQLFGRDWEASQLVDLLIGKRVVLLHSPSGAGKTSLLHMKVIPALETADFQVLPIMRLGLESVSSGNRYLRSAASYLLDVEPDAAPPHVEPPAKDAADKPQVLIFDQFEEIFSIDPTDASAKREFFNEIGALLRRDRDRWALFAMREDYLGELDPYVDALPTRLSTRFRLALLENRSAQLAIQASASGAGVTIASPTAQALVADLSTVMVTEGDGAAVERAGLYVEPVQLQVVCVRTWERLQPQVGDLITDLSSIGNVDETLADYYTERVASVAAQRNVPERRIRDWFDQQLITPQRVRGQVLHEPGASRGLPNEVIDALIDVYLVRAEPRRGLTWYELAHDRLIEPIRTNNAAWLSKHLAAWQRQAELWAAQRRPEALLLADDTLAAAEATLGPHRLELTQDETDFLTASRERCATRAHDRRRRGLTLVAVFGLVAIVLALAVNAAALSEASNQSRAAATQASAAAASAALAATASSLADQARLDLAAFQRDDAVRQQEQAMRQAQVIAASRLALEATRHVEGQLDLALLLGLQANRLADEPVEDARRIFAFDVASANPRLSKYVRAGPSHTPLIAFGPRSGTLAIGGSDGSIALWSEERFVERLGGGTGAITGLAYTPDETQLVVGTDDGRVLVWNLQSRQASEPFPRGASITALAVSPTPTRPLRAFARFDGSLTLWDPRAGGTINQLVPGVADPRVFSLAFDHDGTLLASGLAGNQGIIVWDLTTSQPSQPLTGHSQTVRALAFSPDNVKLASGSEDATAMLWDLNTHRPINGALNGHSNWVTSVAFSDDGRVLATASNDSTVQLWDVNLQRPMGQSLLGHRGNVKSVAFSPSNGGNLLASGGDDGNVILWDLAARPSLIGQTGRVETVVFSPDGAMLASGGGDSSIVLWNTVTRVPEKTLTAHTRDVRSLAFSPDGRWLISAGGDGRLIQWDLRASDMTPDILLSQGEDVDFRWTGFSADASTLAALSADGRVWLRDMRTGLTRTSATPVDPDGALVAAFNPRKPELAIGVYHGSIVLWDVERNQQEARLDHVHTEDVQAVAFSPDGKTLAAGSNDDTVSLWDVASRSRIGNPLLGHSDDVRSVAFSPDGGTLATASQDRTVRLWDVASRSQLGPSLTDHAKWVVSLAFNQDGTRLASGGEDQSIILWQVPSRDAGVGYKVASERACRTANRNLSLAEWQTYLPADRAYERTCVDLPSGEGADSNAPSAPVR